MLRTWLIALACLAAWSGPAPAQDFAYSFKSLRLPSGDRGWLHLPEDAAGDKLPVVLIGPAGSTLIDGMSLSEGDKA
jgi:hypothetical protein